MLTLDTLLMIVASLLLLVVNWLAFHDFGEAHSMRDWLVLLGSLLVLFEFGRQVWIRNFGRR